MTPHPLSHVSTIHDAEVPTRRLWLGLLIAPAAWVVQGLLGWYVGYMPCESASTGTARAWLGIITAIALIAGASGLAIAWRSWGRVTESRRVTDVKGWDRVEFMSATGVLTSGMFIIGIVWAGLIAVFVHQCGWMR